MVYEGKEMCYFLPETVCKLMSNSVLDNNNNKKKPKIKQKGRVISSQIETPWSGIFAI